MAKTRAATDHSQTDTAPLRSRACAAAIWPRLKDVPEAVACVMR